MRRIFDKLIEKNVVLLSQSYSMIMSSAVVLPVIRRHTSLIEEREKERLSVICLKIYAMIRKTCLRINVSR